MGKKNKEMSKEDEAAKVQKMMKAMASRIEIGEQWFIISMKWIKKWQKYVGIEQTEDDDDNRAAQSSDDAPSPGKIDNSNILVNDGLCEDLEEQALKFQYQNYQLKPKLKEGDDFMIVDADLHDFWKSKYGEKIALPRYGIKSDDDTHSVEVYFK